MFFQNLHGIVSTLPKDGAERVVADIKAIETEGTHAVGVIGSDFEKQFVVQTPLGRTGEPDNIAPVAVFLASGESRWVTGDTLAGSGGLG